MQLILQCANIDAIISASIDAFISVIIFAVISAVLVLPFFTLNENVNPHKQVLEFFYPV